MSSLKKLNNHLEKVECHFCLNETLVGKINISNDLSNLSLGDPNNWLCKSCNCWNRKDVQGNYLNFEESMANENLNLSSFNKRGKLLGFQYQSLNPFCTNCLTNQQLIFNLLTNFANQNDDDQSIQNYRLSLESRYPPLCDKCSTNVDKVINERNYKVKSNVLNHHLLKSRLPKPKTFNPLGRYTVFAWFLRGTFFFSFNLSFFWLYYYS